MSLQRSRRPRAACRRPINYRLLQQRDIAVHHTVTNPRQNYGERRWEFDIVAINGEEVVVVVVKTTL